MRRILVDFARRRPRIDKDMEAVRMSLDEALTISTERDPDLLALDDALKSLATIDERKSRIVELRFFGGLSVDETAEVMQLSTITIIREWTRRRDGNPCLHVTRTSVGRNGGPPHRHLESRRRVVGTRDRAKTVYGRNATSHHQPNPLAAAGRRIDYRHKSSTRTGSHSQQSARERSRAALPNRLRFPCGPSSIVAPD